MLPDVLENSGTGRTSTGSLATTSILSVSVTVSPSDLFLCLAVRLWGGFSEKTTKTDEGYSPDTHKSDPSSQDPQLKSYPPSPQGPQLRSDAKIDCPLHASQIPACVQQRGE